MRIVDALACYAAGLFPMDDPELAGEPLPWYVADPRAVLELDATSRDALRRQVRRSLRRCDSFELARDRAFEDVLGACARPRRPDDGCWITPRLGDLYRALHAGGAAHSYELWHGDELAAGVLAVRVGPAAMLESMFHAVPDAGNALLSRMLDALVAEDVALCDIQLPTDHTRRLGARAISRVEYERRLHAALAG